MNQKIFIKTEGDSEFFLEKTPKNWRKWVKLNMRNPNDNDPYLLMKHLLEEMKTDRKTLKKTFQNTQFLNKLFEESDDIAASAYIFSKISHWISDFFEDSFTEILKRKMYEFFKNDTFEAHFYYPNDASFKSIDKMSRQMISLIREKISVVLEALGPEANYEDLPKKQGDSSNSKVKFYLDFFRNFHLKFYCI